MNCLELLRDYHKRVQVEEPQFLRDAFEQRQRHDADALIADDVAEGSQGGGPAEQEGRLAGRESVTVSVLATESLDIQEAANM